MKHTHLILVFLFCLSAASCENVSNGNYAGTDTTATARNESVLTNGEDNFVVNTIEANAEELSLLRASLNTATDTGLLAHAQQMITDHEQMDVELKSLAATKNVDISNADTSIIAQLSEKPGPDWDEEWADEIGDMHRTLIRRFERAQNFTKDADLKALIDKSLPTLRSHMQMAEQLEERLDKKD